MQAEHLTFRADAATASVPTRVGRNRNRNRRKQQRAEFIVVRAALRHVDDVTSATDRRLNGRTAEAIELRPAIEVLWLLDHFGIPDAGDALPSAFGFAPANQRAVGDARVRARRRFLASADPFVERGQQRSQHRPIIRRIANELPAARSRPRDPATGSVLRATETIDANFRRQLRVPSAERIGVNQRAGTMPVLAAALRVHDLRHRPTNTVAMQDALLATGERVGLVAVGERELIGRKQMVVVLPVVSRRRGEPMIEEPQTSTRDVRNHSVEDLPPRLVRVEAVVQKLPQTTSRLRHAKAVDEFGCRLFCLGGEQRILGRRLVFQERQQIANAGQAESLHDRTLSLVDDFIDVPRLQSAGDDDVNVRQLSPFAVVFDPAFLEAPLTARDDDSRIFLARTPRQHRVALASFGRLVAPLIRPHRQRVAFGR